MVSSNGVGGLAVAGWLVAVAYGGRIRVPEIPFNLYRKRIFQLIMQTSLYFAGKFGYFSKGSGALHWLCLRI